MPLAKPDSCSGCQLSSKGTGWIPADGPDTAPILLVGEAGGRTEAHVGRPFVGDAGGMLQRVLNLLGWDRQTLRIDNCVRCSPPGDWLVGAPWEMAALDHCSTNLAASLASPSLKVVVPMGGTALKRILLVSGKKVGPENFHGTLSRDPHDRFWVVPTFHPSHLQRGAHNLIGTVIWDLQQAQQAAQGLLQPDRGSLVLDPPLDWFAAWVDQVCAAIAQDPEAYPVSVDVETPDKAHGKDEDTITAEDRSFTILRVNVACSTEEGVTVPFQGPYIDLLARLLGAGSPLWLWNKAYDIPRLQAAGVIDEKADVRAFDLMWLWHYLQSDLPRGLGFVAPFYSRYGPWKHLADSDPALYGAVDGLQTHRVGFGITHDLLRLGMLEDARRHIHQLEQDVLKPAHSVGVRIDRQRLLDFKAELGDKATSLLNQLQTLVPDALRNLTPKDGLTAPPADNVVHVKASAFTRKGEARKGKPASEVKLNLYKQAVVVTREVEKEVWVCRTCGESEVHKKHRCRVSYTKRDGSLGWKPADYDADLQLESRTVTRWFWSEPFNPDSPQQVLAYIKHQKHQPGKAKKSKKSKKPTTDRETLNRLTRTGDPFYATLLDYRAVIKVKGTYVDGTERRMDSDDRVHPEFTFKPSTHRLSAVNPNITNVIQDRGGQASLAAGFRRTVVASPGCRLLEVDFSGSEAVDVGWFARDPSYIRLAKLGVHAGLASHILGKPYDPAWSEADLGAYFKTIKESPEGSPAQVTYNRAKRFVHGYSYGLTTHGMVLQFPEIFPTKKVAEHYEAIFRQMAPKIPGWQRTVRERAFRQHYLGGPGDHPFGYKHWFWSVYTYKKITAGQYWTALSRWRQAGKDDAEAPLAVINGQHFKVALGDDGKRCVAFYPQSTTAAKLKEAALRLFAPDSPSYIGEAYFGKTPLRALIHDSLLLEIPVRTFDYVATLVVQEMQRPIVQMPCPEDWRLGPYLVTTVSAKTGLNWMEMEKLSASDLGVGTDTITTGADPDDAEDVEDLGRTA